MTSFTSKPVTQPVSVQARGEPQEDSPTQAVSTDDGTDLLSGTPAALVLEEKRPAWCTLLDIVTFGMNSEPECHSEEHKKAGRLHEADPPKGPGERAKGLKGELLKDLTQGQKRNVAWDRAVVSKQWEAMTAEDVHEATKRLEWYPKPGCTMLSVLTGVDYCQPPDLRGGPLGEETSDVVNAEDLVARDDGMKGSWPCILFSELFNKDMCPNEHWMRLKERRGADTASPPVKARGGSPSDVVNADGPVARDDGMKGSWPCILLSELFSKDMCPNEHWKRLEERRGADTASPSVEARGGIGEHVCGIIDWMTIGNNKVADCQKRKEKKDKAARMIETPTTTALAAAMTSANGGIHLVETYVPLPTPDDKVTSEAPGARTSPAGRAIDSPATLVGVSFLSGILVAAFVCAAVLFIKGGRRRRRDGKKPEAKRLGVDPSDV